jgi:Domain of unknown function (DUF4260)
VTNLLKLEEFFLFMLALFLFSGLDYGWGWYALPFLTPDLSALSYLANPHLGAWTLRHAQGNAYNLIHHKGVAVAFYILGSLLSVPWPMFAALCAILLGHSSLDRVFGYGLKYSDAFQNTHLGRIGR